MTDLGTEFGVEVSKEGHTTSHVFRGSVKLQLLGGGAANEGNTIVLHENESVRTEKSEGVAGPAVAVRRVDADPTAFVRRIASSPTSIDLLDIVAGGSGAGHRRERGIDPTTGMSDSLFVASWRPGDREYHRTTTYRLIDGVFVPDGGQGSVQLDSAGHTFSGFPRTNGKSWGSIWARAAGVPPEARAMGAEYWVYAVDFPENLMPRKRGLLGLAGNAGITFDLAAIRKAHGDRQFTRFRATAALCGNDSGDQWVFVDGRRQWKATRTAAANRAIPVDVAIGPTDRFLTLAATGGSDATARSGAAFGDPVLETASSEADAAIAAVPTLAVAPSAKTIYSENFEGMSAGPLCGQGGWAAGFHTGTINVGAGGRSWQHAGPCGSHGQRHTRRSSLPGLACPARQLPSDYLAVGRGARRQQLGVRLQFDARPRRRLSWLLVLIAHRLDARPVRHHRR